MSSFTGKTNAELAITIAGDGFYPNLSLGDFQRDYRVPAEYQADMVANELELSAANIADLLAEQRTTWALVPYASLAAAETGEGRDLIVWYYRAVYSAAKAALLRQFVTMAQRAAANNQAKENPGTQTYYRAQSHRAVRKILGKPGISAQLL